MKHPLRISALCLTLLLLLCACGPQPQDEQPTVDTFSLSENVVLMLGAYNTLDNLHAEGEHAYVSDDTVEKAYDTPWMPHELHTIDENAPAQIGVNFRDTPYLGTYAEEYIFPYATETVHVYATEDGTRFGIDPKTGKMNGIHLPQSAPDYSIPLSESAAESLVLSVFPDDIDQARYVKVVTGQEGEGFLFEYVKYYRGIPTTEKIAFQIDNSGTIRYYYTTMLGAYPTDDTPLDTTQAKELAQNTALALYEEEHVIYACHEQWILIEGEPGLCYQIELIPLEYNSGETINTKYVSLAYVPIALSSILP